MSGLVKYEGLVENKEEEGGKQEVEMTAVELEKLTDILDEWVWLGELT